MSNDEHDPHAEEKRAMAKCGADVAKSEFPPRYWITSDRTVFDGPPGTEYLSLQEHEVENAGRI